MDRLTTHEPNRRLVACRANCESWDSIYDRLAAYEDTGLEPLEVDTMNTALCGWCHNYERLVEITNAEAEDRLIVLPCKVGDTVYVITERTNSFGEVRQFVQKKKVIKVDLENDGLWIVVDDYDSWEAYPVGSKRLFFTHEAAEAALGGDHDG